jgi:hypothetical protein
MNATPPDDMFGFVSTSIRNISVYKIIYTMLGLIRMALYGVSDRTVS